MAALTIVRGPDKGRRVELSQADLRIGRDAANGLRLHDTEASRQHAELRRSGSGYSLQDLNSSNGTKVNGAGVTLVSLSSGDQIRIGRTEMIFTADAAPAPADISQRIQMLDGPKLEGENSAIVRSISHAEGTRFLHHPEQAGGKWLRQALANLAVMYETSSAISRIADIDQLLAHILKLIFDSIRPERGCVMLREAESGPLKARAVRYAEGEAQDETIELSGSIVDWVLERAEGIVLLDAAGDDRFGGSKSVLRLGIREAICVPLRGRYETFGVIYADVRSEAEVLRTQDPTRMGEDQLKLMIAIAHQAALAIEDHRFYQAMMQAERLAGVGQTVAVISHHVKNVLQGLRSGSYLVENGLKREDLEVARDGWQIVRKNQEKIYGLVMDMLSYSKEREPLLEPCDVHEVVRDVVELVAARAAEQGTALECDLPDRPLRTSCDREAVHRALLNIVGNALDAVAEREGAKVSVRTASDPTTRFLAVQVRDNGVGIAADQLGRIFEVFHSTKGGKGTGLGLAVTQKTAKEHGGRVRVHSEPGVGSTFSFELPIRKAAQAVPLATEADIDPTGLPQ